MQTSEAWKQPGGGGGGGVTQNIVGTHTCPKKRRKGSLFWPKASTTSLRKRVVFQSNLRRFWEKGCFQSNLRPFWEKGLLLSCPTPFRGRFWHQGLRHLGSNIEVLGQAWVPLQSASDPPPPGGGEQLIVMIAVLMKQRLYAPQLLLHWMRYDHDRCRHRDSTTGMPSSICRRRRLWP